MFCVICSMRLTCKTKADSPYDLSLKDWRWAMKCHKRCYEKEYEVGTKKHLKYLALKKTELKEYLMFIKDCTKNDINCRYCSEPIADNRQWKKVWAWKGMILHKDCYDEIKADENAESISIYFK